MLDPGPIARRLKSNERAYGLFRDQRFVSSIGSGALHVRENASINIQGSRDVEM